MMQDDTEHSRVTHPRGQTRMSAIYHTTEDGRSMVTFMHLMSKKEAQKEMKRKRSNSNRAVVEQQLFVTTTYQGRRHSVESISSEIPSIRVDSDNNERSALLGDLGNAASGDSTDQLHVHQKNKEDGDDAEVEDDELTTSEYLYDVVFGKPISFLLLAAPFAIWASYGGWSPLWIFILNFLVMIPLAAILGDFTEELALHTNQTIGGLVNATFGNAVEVVVSIQALLADEIRVVQASLLGSIFSNLLLVLGCCFFFGGLIHKEQPFNSTAATANIGLLGLSTFAVVLPTPFAAYYDLEDEKVLHISRIAAVLMIFMYAQYLYFQLSTHAYLFDDDDGDELSQTSLFVASMGLLVTTLLVTYFSEFLVDSIGGFCAETGVSRTFVGVILLPIVGNAVEHVTAVTVAMKNKMDLAMGVAVGSSTQISLFVIPLTVLVGWSLNKDMTLNFPAFEVILFCLSVVFVSILFSNPSGNWLEGSLLITTYVLIAVGFWYEEINEDF